MDLLLFSIYNTVNTDLMIVISYVLFYVCQCEEGLHCNGASRDNAEWSCEVKVL